MAIAISPERARALEAVTYGLNGSIGGIARTTYYTPDGRTINAIPSIREFALKDKNGKIISTGTRDANLDKGWLLIKPKRTKLFCSGCDRWHDTQKQIDACVLKSQKFIEMAGAKARQELVTDNVNKDIKIDELTKKVEALAKLVEELSGKAVAGD